MRNRIVASAVLGTALLLVGFVTPASAQTPGATVGAGISFLNSGDAEATGIGFTLDVAKDVKALGSKAQLGIVGDFGWHSFSAEDDNLLFEDVSTLTLMGGARVSFDAGAKVRPFGQFLIGMMNFSPEESDSDTELAYAPGFGVDIKLNEKVAIRGQIDFVIADTEGESSNFTRYWFGVSFGVGK